MNWKVKKILWPSLTYSTTTQPLRAKVNHKNATHADMNAWHLALRIRFFVILKQTSAKIQFHVYLIELGNNQHHIIQAKVNIFL